MVTTPLILAAQRKWFARNLNVSADEALDSDIVNKEPRVIIAGFGRFGQIVGRLMYANKIKITVLESDPSQIKLLRKYGYKVFYGDATHLELLRAAGADEAEAIVICTDAPDEVMKIVELCQHHFPRMKILARARSRVEAYQLLNHGVGVIREKCSSARWISADRLWLRWACIRMRRSGPKRISAGSTVQCLRAAAATQ